MVDLDTVLKVRSDLFNHSMSLVAKKGADYNREQQIEGDTLFNLRVCQILGIVPHPTAGVLVRLSDKFMRLISLTKDPSVDAAVKAESVIDTVADVHNYVDMLLCLWLEAKGMLPVPQLKIHEGPQDAVNSDKPGA